MNSMTNTDYLYKCEFCGVANDWSYMYWVQGKELGIDEPNCCGDCVEYEDDDDESDDDENDGDYCLTCGGENPQLEYDNICYECYIKKYPNLDTGIEETEWEFRVRVGAIKQE